MKELNHFSYYILKSLVLVYTLSASNALHGQTLTDSVVLKLSIAQAKKVYEQSIQGQAHLYNGSEYKAYESLDEEHPYFESDDWENGSIEYDHESYQNVPMLYDLQKDIVVIQNYYNSDKMELLSKRIECFNIVGHTFVWKEPDSASTTRVKPGFYDLMYDGQLKVLVKHNKILKQTLEFNSSIIEFIEETQLFIIKNETWFPVKNKASVLKALIDQKKELKKYIGRTRLNFKKDGVNALVSVARFYDLTKK